MMLKTYRAKTMHEALQLVRHELGPDASVLQTREVRNGFLGWLGGERQVEVVASNEVAVPRRFVDSIDEPLPPQEPECESPIESVPEAHEHDFRGQFKDDLRDQGTGLNSMLEELCRRTPSGTPETGSAVLFRLFTDLLDAEVHEETARQLIERLRAGMTPQDLNDEVLLRARLARFVEEDIQVCGPLRVTPGHRRLVALVGPTGVGKTTTIAKLAAHFHLREKRRVGLITVDTYRIAAVDQLRTYADIINLPMEVVATPREMRASLDRMSHLDLVLMDTAGRSPHDEVRIQELRALLAEAHPDEVHLVLSSVGSLSSLQKAVRHFAAVGATALMLSKLDEATGLGSLLGLLRGAQLPLSYVTTGQNVPDDIQAADRRSLARQIIGVQERPW